MLICGDSDWGDEEATVVCRKRGYLRGTGGGELQYCLWMNLRSWLCLKPKLIRILNYLSIMQAYKTFFKESNISGGFSALEVKNIFEIVL